MRLVCIFKYEVLEGRLVSGLLVAEKKKMLWPGEMFNNLICVEIKRTSDSMGS